MTETIAHIEEAVRPVTARAAAPRPTTGLAPAFTDALRGAATALDKAHQMLTAGTTHPDIDEPEPVREAAHAVETLRGLMNEWEDIPNALLDAIDGALHETRAALTVMEEPNRNPQLVDEAAIHLMTARTRINDILGVPTQRVGAAGGEEIGARVIEDPTQGITNPAVDPDTPHIMGKTAAQNPGIVPPWLQVVEDPTQGITNPAVDPDTPHIMDEAIGPDTPHIMNNATGQNPGIVPPWLQ